MAEKGGVVAIKGGVVTKAATLANRGGFFSRGDHFLCQEKPFFHDIFLGRLMQLLLKQSKEIAFADKQMSRDLLDPRNRAKILVGIPQRLGDERGEGGLFLREGVGEQTDVIKQLGQKVGKDPFKGFTVAVLIIEIAFLKDILNDAVA